MKYCMACPSLPKFVVGELRIIEVVFLGLVLSLPVSSNVMPRPSISLKARALKYLSSREHSRLELARKLAPYAQDGDDIEALLNWLEQSSFLSSERFSESLVNRRAARYGNNRILSELHSHGIGGDTLTELKADLVEGENERAVHVLRRKFSEPPADAEMRARQIRFLQQRGFSHRSIRDALQSAWTEDGV